MTSDQRVIISPNKEKTDNYISISNNFLSTIQFWLQYGFTSFSMNLGGIKTKFFVPSIKNHFNCDDFQRRLKTRFYSSLIIISKL